MRQGHAQQLLLNWYEQMVLCFERELSFEERKELQRWEKDNLSSTVGTSDWPGWEPRIGKAPKPARLQVIVRRRA